jgi:hypothetical protein
MFKTPNLHIGLTATFSVLCAKADLHLSFLLFYTSGIQLISAREMNVVNCWFIFNTLKSCITFHYISLTNLCVTNHKKEIQIFIYYVVEVTLITFIFTSICKLFVVKLIVVLTFFINLCETFTGRYDIARALEKWGGLHEVSRLLSLKIRHPNRQGNPAKDKKIDYITSTDTEGETKTPSKPYISSDTQKWLTKLKHLDINWVE